MVQAVLNRTMGMGAVDGIALKVTIDYLDGVELEIIK
jgi:hypothetical protein